MSVMDNAVKRRTRFTWKHLMALVAVLALVLSACTSGGDTTEEPADDASPAVGADIAAARGLTDADIEAALKTYTPSGMLDEYIMFSSGGHGGQVNVVGMPSMRLLKTIAVFTPEPWQGYGYGDAKTEELLADGSPDGIGLGWGDTHHPALSETGGEYDGEFLFINDKANARIATIDLRDFETKQIVVSPFANNDHGGAMVTPDTDWIIEGGQYATPLPYEEYSGIDEYEENYRGYVTFWSFDREAGRIDEDASFAIELPPYFQDLCDAGKLVSDGWVFCNSFNTEMATGGIEEGNAPFEGGVSEGSFDYLHVINLDAAAAVAASGKTEDLNGFPIISLETAIDEGLVYFVPEPKSPHGVDVTPKGDYMVVSGKLDPNVTIYSFDKIQDAIAGGEWTEDVFGVPVLDFDATVEAQVEVGLGPLHTQFGPDGYAYTSLFLDSAVARWTLGPDYNPIDEPWTLVTQTPVQYNIGHLTAAEGDTVSPDGKYLVALNKWSIDRFNNVGPLLPQNFQLVDIGESGETMPVLYDMPVTFGEPHYAQIIKADKLDPFEVYPEVGYDPATMSVDPDAPQIGDERVERNGDEVHVYMTAVRSHFTPERVDIREGDKVTWHITNVETSRDATHGFAIPRYNINLSLEPGETATFEFEATEGGVYSYYCTEFCSALHLEMIGYMTVGPPA